MSMVFAYFTRQEITLLRYCAEQVGQRPLFVAKGEEDTEMKELIEKLRKLDEENMA